MNLKKEGSATFWLRHERCDWATDTNGYNFGNMGNEIVSVSVKKHPTQILEIEVDGPFNKGFVFTVPVPACDKRGIYVAITWKKKAVTLYLNGQLIGTIKA